MRDGLLLFVFSDGFLGLLASRFQFTPMCSSRLVTSPSLLQQGSVVRAARWYLGGTRLAEQRQYPRRQPVLYRGREGFALMALALGE